MSKLAVVDHRRPLDEYFRARCTSLSSINVSAPLPLIVCSSITHTLTISRFQPGTLRHTDQSRPAHANRRGLVNTELAKATPSLIANCSKKVIGPSSEGRRWWSVLVSPFRTLIDGPTTCRQTWKPPFATENCRIAQGSPPLAFPLGPCS